MAGISACIAAYVQPWPDHDRATGAKSSPSDVPNVTGAALSTTMLHAMAGGKLQQAVPVRSRDELGELSAALNTMSADLHLANTQRRQMTADVAHDLRTPVTVIAGYL